MLTPISKSLYLSIFLLLTFGCREFIKRPANRVITGYVSWKFYLQPFNKAKIYIGDREARPRLLHSDKSFGFLKVKVPAYKDKLGFLIKIEKTGFQGFKQDIFLQTIHHAWLSKPHTFVLDQSTSRHRFHSYHRVGRQPKSVTFINEKEVSIPLLNDTGIDILNIETGLKKHIQPPDRYARRGGFVESLILEDKEELWVSQMTLAMIHIFDLKNLEYKTSVSLSGKWVKVMVYHSERELVYASNWLSKDISVINTNTYKEIKRVSVNGVPRGLWVDTETNSIYAAQFGQMSDVDKKGKLIQIDIDQDMILTQLGEPGAKRHIVYSDLTEQVYVSDMKQSQIEVYNIEDHLLITKFSVWYKPNTIALDPSHRYLYVSCRGPNSAQGYRHKGNSFGKIEVIDLEEDEKIDSWEGGNQPTGLDVSPDGKYVAFSDFLDDAVRVYELPIH